VKQSKPFFSIIIPTYNRATLIQPTLDSVLTQTFQNWECIVVDDGSTDNTRELITSYIQKDERFRYVYQTNAERSVARNNGIGHASGEWICFLDSDDLYSPKHLMELSEAIQGDSCSAFYFIGCTTLTDGVFRQNEFEIYDGSPDYFIRNSVIPARVCIHRSLLEKFQFDPEIVIVEDTVLWTHLHLRFPTKQLPLFGAIYRWHDDNSVQLIKNCFFPRLNGLLRLFSDPYIQKNISKKAQRAAIANCYYGIAKFHELKRNFVDMCWWSLRSIAMDPRSPQTKAKIYMIYAFYR
jgi:glycosyltransferase involved in cell wall biosynthesis